MYQYLLDNMVKGKLRFSEYGPYETGPWAVVDFDGVVVSAKHIRKNEDDFGVPLTNIASMINSINDQGYKVLLYTTRKISQGAVKWLRNKGVYFHAILSLPTKKNPYSGLIFYDEDTLYFDEDEMDSSLERVKRFLKDKEVKIKKKYGITPREIQANKHKYKWKVQDYINGNVLPIHITSVPLD